MFSTVDFASEFDFDNSLDQYTGYNEDEEFQSDEGPDGYDWVANYVYHPRMGKRNHYTQRTGITQECCTKPCNATTLTEYCYKG